jgi:hypothetical protein
MEADDGERYVHAETKPFEPYLSRSIKRKQTTLFRLLHFTLLFLAILSGRAIWDLHAAGRPVAGLIFGSAGLAAALAIGPAIRSKFKERPPDKDASQPD